MDKHFGTAALKIANLSRLCALPIFLSLHLFDEQGGTKGLTKSRDIRLADRSGLCQKDEAEGADRLRPLSWSAYQDRPRNRAATACGHFDGKRLEQIRLAKEFSQFGRAAARIAWSNNAPTAPQAGAGLPNPAFKGFNARPIFRRRTGFLPPLMPDFELRFQHGFKKGPGIT